MNAIHIYMRETEIIQAYLATYNSFDIERMLSFFVDDCVFENVSNSGNQLKCNGINELKATAQKSATLFKSRRQQILDLIVADNKAAVMIDYEGVLASDLPNGMKAGQKLQLKGVSFFNFKDGKIQRLTDFS